MVRNLLGAPQARNLTGGGVEQVEGTCPPLETPPGIRDFVQKCWIFNKNWYKMVKIMDFHLKVGQIWEKSVLRGGVTDDYFLKTSKFSHVWRNFIFVIGMRVFAPSCKLWNDVPGDYVKISLLMLLRFILRDFKMYPLCFT